MRHWPVLPTIRLHYVCPVRETVTYPVACGAIRLNGDHNMDLIAGTDSLALIALGGFAILMVVSIGILVFVLKKLPARR